MFYIYITYVSAKVDISIHPCVFQWKYLAGEFLDWCMK